MQAPESHAQEKGKSKYEKKLERKNRKNRKLKRSKDEAKSNRRQRRMARFKMRTRQGEKAYRGDISGRRLQPRTSSRNRVIHPQPNPYAGRKRMTERRRAKYLNSSPRYSSRPREKASRGQAYQGGSVRTTFAGKKAYKFKPWLTASRPSERAKRTKRIVPRSASGAYVRNKRKNPYAWRERSKWEEAYKGDIAGQPVRVKRTTDRPAIQGPPTFKNRRTTRRGDQAYNGRAFPRKNMSATRRRERAYSGKAAGGYVSATRPGEKAYSGRAFPRKNMSATRRSETAGVRRGRTSAQMSATRRGEKAYSGRAFPRGNLSATRGPETAGNRIGKSRRRLSVSRQGEHAGKSISRGRIGGNGFGLSSTYRGSMRARKPSGGGGSISGGLHNNNGRSLARRGVQTQDIRVARHTGNIRTTRGLKGGGSMSAKMRRNNNDRPVRGFAPGRQDRLTGNYQGNLRFGGRPPKNKGKSLARAQWNNKGEPVKGRAVSLQDADIAAFKGRTKGRRNPPKGAGGSVSVLPWNNDEEPLEQKVPGKDTRIATSFQGRQKRGFRYVRNPSSAEDALKVKPVGKGTTQAMSYQGSQKRRFSYRKNPNSADGALKGIGPSRAMVQASQFQGNVKMSRKRYENRHPSHKFEGNSRTASNQRKGFSFKVLWSRLFKKQENQPDHLKEKERKPRFDKGEKGLWND